ncbi:MAG: hypothetical protein J5637_06985, partial [Prevotella sp.]|nr:hypothetical protein [Prevotella sp.]
AAALLLVLLVFYVNLSKNAYSCTQIGAITPKADAKVRTMPATAKFSERKFHENMKVFAFLDKMRGFCDNKSFTPMPKSTFPMMK